jgi:hypothetical protein
MNSIDWEIFDMVVNITNILEFEPGPLYNPINDIKIKRNEDLEIIIETECDITAVANKKQYPLGTLRENLDYAKFKLSSEFVATIKGINSSVSHEFTSKGNKTFESVQVNEFLYEKNHQYQCQYVIEWLANVDGDFLAPWPEFIENIEEHHMTRNFGRNSLFSISKIKKPMGGMGGCINMNIGGHSICFGHRDKSKINKQKKPGFILYANNLPEATRKKIRFCLSFFLGRPLVYLGETCFDEKWDVVSLKAVNPYTEHGRYFNIPNMPPCLLGHNSRSKIDTEVFSNMVNAFYNNFEKYNLEHVSYLYWRAMSAAVHTAPLHFGCAIEKIHHYYGKANADKFDVTILESKEFNNIKKMIEENIQNCNIDPDKAKLITNKIHNNLPPTEQLKMLMNKLGLKFTPLEENAWNQRNFAAHGGEITNDKAIKIIKETTILRLLFHRIVLRLTQASNYYVDYFSEGYPNIKLEDSKEI